MRTVAMAPGLVPLHGGIQHPIRSVNLQQQLEAERDDAVHRCALMETESLIAAGAEMRLRERIQQLETENQQLKERIASAMMADGTFLSDLMFAMTGTREPMVRENILEQARALRDDWLSATTKLASVSKVFETAESDWRESH